MSQLPKIIIQLSPFHNVALDASSFTTTSTSPKNVTFTDILDLLQDKLEIVFPAKSNDSAISKIFSSPDYQSILSQPSLDLEQQVVFLLWSVKAKSKKNFLSGMVRSSLKKKINDNSSLPNGSLKYSTTTNNNGSLLSVESQESDLSVSSDCGLKIKKKLLKMSDTVHSFSGEW